MAAYPTFPQLIGSSVKWVDDLNLDRASGGGVRGRAFYSGKKAVVTLRHRLTNTQLGTLASFYDSNRTTGGVSVVWQQDNSTLSNLWFDGPPSPEPVADAPLYSDVEVNLSEQ